jgi:hypothetical protein
MDRYPALPSAARFRMLQRRLQKIKALAATGGETTAASTQALSTDSVSSTHTTESRKNEEVGTGDKIVPGGDEDDDEVGEDVEIRDEVGDRLADA